VERLLGWEIYPRIGLCLNNKAGAYLDNFKGG